MKGGNKESGVVIAGWNKEDSKGCEEEIKRARLFYGRAGTNKECGCLTSSLRSCSP